MLAHTTRGTRPPIAPPLTRSACSRTERAGAARSSIGVGLHDDTTVQVLRHNVPITLARGGTDLVIVAELLGHARLETTRIYTRPSAEDRTRALDLLPVDK